MFAETSNFKKGLGKLPRKIQKRVAERLAIFEADEFDPILNNHQLSGEYDRYRSINITGNIRLVFRKTGTKEYLLFDIGTHTQLYG